MKIVEVYNSRCKLQALGVNIFRKTCFSAKEKLFLCKDNAPFWKLEDCLWKNSLFSHVLLFN